MNSTSRVSCTGFVPESITGDPVAGQELGDRYRSRLEMKRTMGNAGQRIAGPDAVDQQVSVSSGHSRGSTVTERFVPDFYRDKIHVSSLTSQGQRLTDTAMTLADAHRLEQTVQDRAWLYGSGVFADDLRTEIETGVSVLDFDQEGVSRFSRRHLLDREDRKAGTR